MPNNNHHNWTREQLIDECRKHLRELGKKMTDEQIIQLYDALEVIVEQVLDRHFTNVDKKASF